MKKGIFGVSVATLAMLYGLLAVILIVIFEVCKLPIGLGIGIAIGVLIIQFLVSPILTDLSMRFFYKADFKHDIPVYLKKFIEEVCAENKMKFPRIGYIDDSAPNAFTYGRTKNDARVILTKGIFERLDEDEIKAVVAHELGHAKHYDMLIMTMVQLVPFILYAIARICANTNSSTKVKTSSKSDSSNGNILIIIAIVAIVLYIITEYIILWLSRSREYYADEFSVATTKNPNALASSLVKIGLGLSVSVKKEKDKVFISENSTLGIADLGSSQAMAASCVGIDGSVSKQQIKDAMKWDLWNTWAKWYEVNSTHPLTSKRILAICSSAAEYGQEPYIDFNEKKPKSYFGNFLKEVIIAMLPWIGFIATIVIGIVSLANNWDNALLLTGSLGVVSCILALLKYAFRHPKKFKEKKVVDLLTEIEVSGVKAVPCELHGQLIGRGDPGCIFNENFVLQDKSGIVLLNYKQPLKTLNKLFAIFRSKNYIDKDVKVVGWFRRNPVPFIDMLYFEVDGKTKKLYSYIAGYVVRIVFLVLFAALAIVPYFIN